jgi:hypothetical protein
LIKFLWEIAAAQLTQLLSGIVSRLHGLTSHALWKRREIEIETVIEIEIEVYE